MIQGIIIRGTTPRHEFALPCPASQLEDIRITYGQRSKALFSKTLDECEIAGEKIFVSLIQEETFLFTPGKQVQVEMRAKLTDGQVIGSEEPLVFRVIDSMNEEVMD